MPGLHARPVPKGNRAWRATLDRGKPGKPGNKTGQTGQPDRKEIQMEKMMLAIDPGATGCLAVLGPDGTYVDHMHMPTIKVGSKTRINGAAVFAWIHQYPIAHCCIEQVQAMPRQGLSSTFSFGHSAGLVEGVITGAGIPVTLVTPQAWKRQAGLIGTDKDAARSRAVQLFPGIRDLDKKAKGQALADALLIGRYGLHKGSLQLTQPQPHTPTDEDTEQ